MQLIISKILEQILNEGYRTFLLRISSLNGPAARHSPAYWVHSPLLLSQETSGVGW